MRCNSSVRAGRTRCGGNGQRAGFSMSLSDRLGGGKRRRTRDGSEPSQLSVIAERNWLQSDNLTAGDQGGRSWWRCTEPGRGTVVLRERVRGLTFGWQRSLNDADELGGWRVRYGHEDC